MPQSALAYADPRREAKERHLALLQEKAKRAQAKRIEAEAGGWATERAKCAADINYWWDRYVWTYDPRLIGKRDAKTGEKLTPFIRFHPWPKQRDLVAFLHARVQAEEEGLVEKSRDTGVTYVCGVYALHRWLFDPGFKATFGSRKAELVDKRDQPDSIFQKLRIILQRLPEQLLPRGYDAGRHDNHMRLFNPETGAMISGEGGDDMGRGGRSTVYFVDEAAFVENAEIVEKALSGNTDCVIWVSTVNGMGNLFARKRHSVLKPRQVFRYHWTDDPRKTPEWAAAKEASYSDPTGWASEYDIDYSASVEGICIPAKWVESCKVLAKLEPRLKPANLGRLGVDVGGGKAKSVAAARFGPVALAPKSRGDADTTATAHWAIEEAVRTGCREINFDAVGIGAGVSSTLMNNPVAGLAVYPINTGLPPTERVWPDDRTSQEMFGNLKAELWWLGRTAAQRTHEHVLWLKGDPLGVEHDVSDLLALPSGDTDSDALCLQLSLVKWGRNEKGKIVIETKQALARRGISSPDYAEAFLMTYAEGESGYDSNMAAWV